MDVLSPDLIWVEGRCYRVNDCLPEVSSNSYSECDLYETDIVTYNEEMEEELDNSIEKSGVDKFTASLRIPRPYLGFIIGAKGSTKRRIEVETRTGIKIPRMGHSGDVTITGHAYQNVAKAKRRINLIIMGARQKQMPTHFLSIPLNSDDIGNNFKKFKELVLSENAQGIEECIFVPAEKLHLTLGMLVLMDDEERLQASQLLSEAKRQVIEPLLKERKLHISLKGISYMNDDPHAVHVLYGDAIALDEDDGILQILADQINEYFAEKGFVKKERNGSVKLHMTLINSQYRNDRDDDNSETDLNNKMKRQSFDASKILAKYRDFDFGRQAVTEIHLSQRFAVGPDGYYQPTCVISTK